MNNKDKGLKDRFNVDDTLNPHPKAISAILALEFGAVTQIVMVPQNISGRNGVKIIIDNKPNGDREKLQSFVDAHIKLLLLQEDGDFVSLLKATKSHVPCTAHMRPEYIDFFYQNPQRTKLSVNGDIETDDRKSIRDFKDSIERISQPDDWIEFSCKNVGVVHLNRNIDISSLEADGNTINIAYTSRSARRIQTICFTVEDAEQLAQTILEKATRPEHGGKKPTLHPEGRAPT